MEVLRLNTKAATGLQGQSGKQRRHIMLVEPILTFYHKFNRESKGAR